MTTSDCIFVRTFLQHLRSIISRSWLYDSGSRGSINANQQLNNHTSRNIMAITKEEILIMGALYILIPISLFLAAGALVSFIWAARKGQFSDLSSPAERVILEDFEKQ